MIVRAAGFLLICLGILAFETPHTVRRGERREWLAAAVLMLVNFVFGLVLMADLGIPFLYEWLNVPFGALGQLLGAPSP